MRTIKVGFIDWWDCFNPDKNLINKILNKHYQVEYSNQPEYIFCSCYSKKFLEYDCIRVIYSAENFAPDFNLFDFAIGFERLNFGDRYLYFPNYLMNLKYLDDVDRMQRKHLKSSIMSCGNKTDFCSMVVSNGMGEQIRIKFFEELSKYKKINSGGRYMNNIGLPEGVENKYLFQRRHKFALAFENSSHPGYCTEKLVEAFAAGTIPIYWGDPCVKEVFNEKAMVIVSDERDFSRAIDQIIEIDNNERLYYQMLEEPALVNPNLLNLWRKQLENFICNIIDSPLHQAKKRSEIPLVKHYYSTLGCADYKTPQSKGLLQRLGVRR